MKKFLYSFLGTVAGIWMSVILGGVLLLVLIGGLVASSGAGNKAFVDDDSVLHLELSGVVVDRESSTSLVDRIYGDATATINLNDVVDAVESAKDDKKIKGLFIDCKGASMGLAQAQALIKAIEDFKKSEKWVYSYSDAYTQSDYYVACAADSVFINPVGMMDIHGLSATTMYFKDLLDKIGVEAQVVKVGTYKSAVEPFMLNQMSEANKEQQSLFLTNIWDYMRQGMASRRGVSPDSLGNVADSFAFARNTEYYVSHRLVDGVKYRHQVITLLAAETGKAKKPALVNVADYLTVATPSYKTKTKAAKNIAVLYALGDITESASEGIASDRLVPVILDLAENESIDGLVLRVNSGGGSAFASEQIWEALEQFKALSGKPFYVSMGDMAASGGYYISCGADRIYAEPLTLTGSIGIFGVIPNFQPLLKDKLGVNTYTVSTNKGAMPTLLEPMSAEQRAAMQGYVDSGYELFVSRCARGRHTTVDKIKSVAEGRVWDGQTAMKHGLVDKMGGLYDALADMAKELGSDSYCIAEYPDVKVKWWELLLKMDSEMEAGIAGTPFGAVSQYLSAIKSVRDMSPLQCRTDYIKLH